MDNRTILLIDDNPDDELLTLRAFKKSRVANPVVVAHDGQEAIDYLFDPSKRLPSIILLDLKLPKIGGLDVLKQLRADTRTAIIPVIILTSSNQDSDLLGSYKLGCNSYIRKPVDFDKFVAAVSQLGLYWLVFNQPPPLSENSMQRS